MRFVPPRLFQDFDPAPSHVHRIVLMGHAESRFNNVLRHSMIGVSMHGTIGYYSTLQGLLKEQRAQRLGTAVVMKWRQSYAACPPLMTMEKLHHDFMVKDGHYKTRVQERQVARVIEAALKDFFSEIQGTQHPQIHYIHANTLRSFVMHIDGKPRDTIKGLHIPDRNSILIFDVHKEIGAIMKTLPAASDGDESGKLNIFA